MTPRERRTREAVEAAEESPAVAADDEAPSVDDPSVEDPEEVWHRAECERTVLHDLWIVLGLGD